MFRTISESGPEVPPKVTERWRLPTWSGSGFWGRSLYSLSIAGGLIGLAISVVAWYSILQRENRFAHQQFDVRADDRFLVLQNGISQYINDILALRAAFQTFDQGISRREFRSLTDSLFNQKDAILSASWAPRVSRDQRTQHEREAIEDGVADYAIKSIARDNSIVPAGDADEYFPVFYTSGRAAGPPVYGVDLNDGGERQRAIELARDTDQPAATPNFILRRGEGDRTGFFVVLPVYKAGLPHGTVEERRRNLAGFVQGVFQTGKMIESILSAAKTPSGLDLYFFASLDGADAPPFYFHGSRARAGPPTPMSRASIAEGSHWSNELRVADRSWTFVAVPAPGGPEAPVHLASWMILFGGLLITGILAAYIWSMRRNSRHLELSNAALDRVVTDLDAANERLTTQNARFVTAINNISLGLGFFDGDRRLIVCNRRLIEMYGLPPDRVRPGTTLAEIVDLRWEVGSIPTAMSQADYLNWRNSVAASKQPTDTTVKLVTGRTIRIRRRPMPDGGWVATHEDVTEQIMSEQALAEARDRAEHAQQDAQAARDRLAEAFELVPEGITLMDADDRLSLWNQRYAEIYSATGDAITAGTRFEDILRAGLARGEYADAIGREEEWLAERLAGHARPANRIEQRLSSGHYVVVEERRTANGGSIGIRIDITDIKQREQSMQLLFDSNPVPMWVVERDTLKFLAVNDAAVAHYGYTRQQFLEMTAFDLRAAHEREAFRRFIEADGGSRGGRIWSHQKADGTSILVLVYSTALTYAGHPANLAAVVDVTERTRVEEMLREQKQLTESAINNMSQGLLMFDEEARLVLSNQRYLEMYNLPADLVKPGCTFVQLLHYRTLAGTFSDDPDAYSRATLAAITAGKTRSIIMEGHDGRTFHVVSRPMPGGGWVATHEDITQRKQAEARIEHLARHDILTDLPNRVAFNAFLSKAVETAAMRHDKIAVISAGLDRFKEVNDVFGHAAGDALLRELSRRLKNAAGSAFIARLGGDEFGLVITEGPQPAAAELMAARLLGAAAVDVDINGHPIRSGLTAGVAIYPNDGADATALLTNAAAGLYRAKREARGSVRFFDSQMDQRLRERRALQQDLRLAIEHRELRLYYQPQASIDGNIIGFEALVRWQHPTRGLISPGLFIPLAEDSGSIVEIGEWILREACREAAAWERPLQIAVNLSPVQFRHGDLPGLVHSVLLETGLAPHRLNLEVTESVLIDDFSRAVAILRRLKALGVRIAMDDFGTGYSSLSYLQAFPFDKIKIDQAFILNLGQNPQSAAIVRAIIGLGRSLALPVTAEGVETSEQLAFLAKEACDEIQGFLIGKPLPIEAYADTVRMAGARDRVKLSGTA
jgi:diguanylate cyclase (GGDEF)-like protein/PAS domain S-box-containing protein